METSNLANDSANDHSTKQSLYSDRIAGSILIGSSILAVFAMLHHPTGAGTTLDEFADHVHSQQHLNRWVHGGAIGLMMAMTCAYSWLFTRLGASRLVNRFALISFSTGALAMTTAALISGFITPYFLAKVHHPSSMETTVISIVLDVLRDSNRAFDELGVAAIAVAVGCWSWCMLTGKQRNWISGLLGCLVTIAGLWGLANGVTGASVSGVLVFACLLAAWSVTCGIALINRRILGK